MVTIVMLQMDFMYNTCRKKCRILYHEKLRQPRTSNQACFIFMKGLHSLYIGKIDETSLFLLSWTPCLCLPPFNKEEEE